MTAGVFPSDKIILTSCVEKLIIKDEAPLISMRVTLTVQLDSQKTWKLATKCSRPVNVTSYARPPGEISFESAQNAHSNDSHAYQQRH